MQVIALKPKDGEPELTEGYVKGRVSVIMPAYNEADCIDKSIRDTILQFKSISDDHEIIVVDDGSTDNTRTLAEDLSSHRVKIISYPKNEGKGHALKVGFLRVTGEFTFIVDSDSEIRARDLNDYAKALRRADIVIGSKRHPLSVVETPLLRRVLSIGYNTLERLLTGAKVTDTQAGFKAGKSSAFYRILPLLSVKRYAFDAELLAVASLLRFKIEEVPVNIRLKSNFSVRQVFRMLIDLLGICYRMRIRKWYQRNMKVIGRTYRPIIRW